MAENLEKIMKRILPHFLTGAGLVSGVVMLAIAMAAPASAAARLLGQHDAWAAYSSGSGKKLTCFVISQPIDTKPKNVNRDPVYFNITHWPREKLYHQISVIIGYPFKKGSVVTVSIGPDKFNLYTKGDGAWVEHHSTEIRMVKLLKKGRTMVVTGISHRGTRTTDTYSLKGVTAALQQLRDECK